MDLTLVIHGTFARDERWWRLGQDGSVTFADLLEEALAREGLAGTVWRPALDAGLSYDDFAWSGENLHRARVAAAKRLRASLAGLAAKMGATEAEPLTVNLVAHSHGGNVVLELLKRLPRGVQLGRLVFLGTPLVTVRPALRLFRLGVAVLILALALLYLLVVAAQVIAFVATLDFLDTAEMRGEVLLLAAVPVVAAYGWIFAGFAAVADRAWRAVAWMARPSRFAVLAGAGAAVQGAALLAGGDLVPWWTLLLGAFVVGLLGQWYEARRAVDRAAYGPDPKKLRRVLGGKPFVLLTSRHDEADVLLKLGAAPRRVYKEEVRHRVRNPLVRGLEFLLIRPIALELLLRGIEVVLERLVFGFGWLQTLFLDYEMADLRTSVAYRSGSIMERLDVTDDLAAGRKVRDAAPALARPVLEAEMVADRQEGVDRHKATLRETLVEVGRYLKAQIILRHSLYYENPAVIRRVARTIVA